MAIVESLKDTGFKRRIDDIVFYQLNDQLIARTVGTISKDRLAKSSQYEAFRKNQREFSLSAQLASTLQQALQPYLHYWKLAYTNSMLTGALRNIIKLGKGNPGERNFDTSFLPQLSGEILNPTKAFLSCGKPLKLDYETGEACIRITYGKLKKFFGSNCLPLRISIGLIALSETEFTKCGYKLVEAGWHGKSTYNNRRILKVWPSKGELRLKVNFDSKIPDGVGLIGIFGVTPL